MSESCQSEPAQRDEAHNYNLYCTVGRGIDPFCTSEINNKYGDILCDIRSGEGKIFFTLSKRITPVLSTAERICIYAYNGAQNLDVRNPAAAVFQLQRIITEQVDWEECLNTWSQYFPELTKPVRFRLNVRVNGKIRKSINPTKVARSCGQRLAWLLKERLKSSVRNPQLSIDIHVNDLSITVGLSLTLCSQAKGGPLHGLRSTTASVMVMLLGLENTRDCCVLDPMCGKGGILHCLPKCCYSIGVDIQMSQLSKCKIHNAELILGDAQCLPIKSKSIDNIICDLPFGLKYACTDLKSFIPKVILEMKRVLKNNGKIVLLMSLEHSSYLDDCLEDAFACQISKFQVSLGLLDAVIHYLTVN